LDAILAKPGIAAFEAHPVIGRIRAAREVNPAAGAVVTMDLVFEAIGIRDMCLRWGDADLRLSNLDALRAHAVGYVSACAAEGAGCTPAGLVAYFNELGLDERAPLPGKNAITVSTWHAAKGREWPFTVIYELDGMPDINALGVQVVSDASRFNILKPLAGRWIRYWPNPYGGASKTPFHERLAVHPANRKACDEAERQSLRLFYVVWTRARDRLVLAARAGQFNKGITELLSAKDGTPLLSEPEGSTATWAGKSFKVKIRTTVPAMPTPTKRVPGEWYECPTKIPEHPPEYVQPSAIALKGQVGQPTEIGQRLRLAGQQDMELVGNAMHGFLAADLPSLIASQRKTIAKGLLTRWDVASALDVESVLSASDALRGWVAQNWPDAQWHREWPLRMRLKSGSTLRGIADLVLETSEGYIVIDHKSFPGGSDKIIEKASSYAGQILAYAEAIRTATGKPVIGCYIHMPVAGVVVPVAQA
jgi:ATP-dependent exoDNAse (exonuclease V) beta subunit